MYDKLAPKQVSVVRVVDEAEDTRTYYIELEKNSEIPRPGQFYMVYAWGFGEIPVSVSDIVLENNELIIGLTIRAVGSVTKYIYENISTGSHLGIRGPYGREWVVDKYTGWDIVVVAGGIGLAPLRPLIKQIAGNIHEYKSLKILYGARSSNQLLYRSEYREWSSKLGVELYLTIDKPEPGWSGFTGFVTELIDKIQFSRKTAVYICGPEIMMKKSIEKLLKYGVDPENIYLSLERRMRCGIGVCGTCQLGHFLVCIDGSVFKYSELNRYMWIDGV